MTTSRLVKREKCDFCNQTNQEFQKDNLKFYIYGEGPYENQLKKVCIGTENIYFYGTYSDKVKLIFLSMMYLYLVQQVKGLKFSY